MTQVRKKILSMLILVCSAVVITGCAGTNVSNFSYDNNYKVNIPVKGEKCYDASVLLGVDIKNAKDIAKKVIVALDSTIAEETDTSIKAQRNRHVGLLVGSGGEELFVNLKAVGDNKTFVTATTKTGFVGAAGQKAWSCKIIDEMIKMATK